MRDALCRQMSIARGDPLLLRENEQRRLEGSRHASASHGGRPAIAFGGRQGICAPPIQEAESRARSAEEGQLPSFLRSEEVLATRVPSNGCEGGTMRYLCRLVESGHDVNGPSLWSCAGACCCHAHMGRAHTFAGRAHAAAGGEKRDDSTAGTPLSCVVA